MLRLSFVATPHKSKVRYSLLLLDATFHINLATIVNASANAQNSLSAR